LAGSSALALATVSIANGVSAKSAVDNRNRFLQPSLDFPGFPLANAPALTILSIVLRTTTNPHL
jgi:hypothetical protein